VLVALDLRFTAAAEARTDQPVELARRRLLIATAVLSVMIRTWSSPGRRCDRARLPLTKLLPVDRLSVAWALCCCSSSPDTVRSKRVLWLREKVMALLLGALIGAFLIFSTAA
jgi:hypothetical protein